MAKYVVDGTLKHDGAEYQHGAEFETEDEQLAAHLRKVGALKLPSELQPPEAVQSELERLRAENEALKATQAPQQQPAPADKSASGKAAAETK